MTKIVKYSDLSLVGPNSDDIDAVVNSIINLLSIMHGELMFNRRLGSRLRDYLFNPLTKSNARLILSEVSYRISKFDPRVEVDKSSNVELFKDQRIYKAKIYLKIKGVERLYPIEKVFESLYEE